MTHQNPENGPQAINRILHGESTDTSSLPEPWRELAERLIAGCNGRDATKVWDELISSRPDAAQLREAVLAASHLVLDTQPSEGLTDAEIQALLDSISRDMPVLPAEAQLSDKLLVQAEKAGWWLDEYTRFALQAAPMTPVEFHEALGLTLLAAATARRLCLQVSSTAIYPNLYQLLIAHSTVWHKTTGFTLANDVLLAAGLQRLTLPSKQTPESLLAELTSRKPTDYEDWEQSEKEIWILERPFAAQRAWLLDEAASLLDSFDRDYTSGLLPIVLELYDCPESKRTSTIVRGRRTVHRAYLTICGPTTPASLQRHLRNKAHWGNGMWARFALITPTSERPEWHFWPQKIDVSSTLSGALHILALERLSVPESDGWGNVKPVQAHAVKLGRQVWEQWEAYSKALYDLLADIPKRLYSTYGRLHTTAMKIAILLAAIDWALEGAADTVAPTVELRHLARAQVITERWRESLHRAVNMPLVDEEDDDDLEARILLCLSQAPQQRMSSRDMARALRMTSRNNREILERMLLRMEKDGQVVQERRKTKRQGRPTMDWTLIRPQHKST